MWLPLVLVVFVVMLFAVRHAAGRFEAEQRDLGRWDEHGPLVETEAPPKGVRGAGMGERLEVIGRWIPRVVRRRRPHEK